MTSPAARSRRLAPIALSLVAFLALACSAAPATPGASAAGGSATPDPSLAQPVNSAPPSGRAPEESGGAGEAVPEVILQQVRGELQRRLGVDVTTATILVAESVVFNDGSLGCPQPGMVYTQALVNGYRVVVAFDGQEYDFRAAEFGGVRLCENPVPAGNN